MLKYFRRPPRLRKLKLRKKFTANYSNNKNVRSKSDTYTEVDSLNRERIRVEMSIRSFFKPKDGLPDPKGSLSSSLPSKAIALANREVEKVTTSETGKKRGQYER